MTLLSCFAFQTAFRQNYHTEEIRNGPPSGFDGCLYNMPCLRLWPLRHVNFEIDRMVKAILHYDLNSF